VSLKYDDEHIAKRNYEPE